MTDFIFAGRKYDLCDMLPCSSFQDGTDCATRKSKFPTDGGGSHAVFVQPSDLANNRISQHRFCLVFANDTTTLLHHVMGVIGCCSHEQMVRSNTQAHITAVQDEQSWRYGAKRHLVGRAVGIVRLLLTGAIRYTISAADSGPLPEPAGTSLGNMSPESLFKWFCFRHKTATSGACLYYNALAQR